MAPVRDKVKAFDFQASRSVTGSGSLLLWESVVTAHLMDISE